MAGCRGQSVDVVVLLAGIFVWSVRVHPGNQRAAGEGFRGRSIWLRTSLNLDTNTTLAAGWSVTRSGSYLKFAAANSSAGWLTVRKRTAALTARFFSEADVEHLLEFQSSDPRSVESWHSVVHQVFLRSSFAWWQAVIWWVLSGLATLAVVGAVITDLGWILLPLAALALLGGFSRLLVASRPAIRVYRDGRIRLWRSLVLPFTAELPSGWSIRKSRGRLVFSSPTGGRVSLTEAALGTGPEELEALYEFGNDEASYHPVESSSEP